MKDVHGAYRKAVFGALNGALTYNSTAVEVFSLEAETEANLYVVIGEATGSPTNENKNKFFTLSTLTIDIIHFQDRAVSTSIVDDVYGQILAILIPSPFSPGFTMDSPFKPGNIQVVSDQHIYEQSIDKVVRKVFRLRCSIEQDEIF